MRRGGWRGLRGWLRGRLRGRLRGWRGRRRLCLRRRGGWCRLRCRRRCRRRCQRRTGRIAGCGSIGNHHAGVIWRSVNDITNFDNDSFDGEFLALCQCGSVPGLSLRARFLNDSHSVSITRNLTVDSLLSIEHEKDINVNLDDNRVCSSSLTVVVVVDTSKLSGPWR